MGEEKLNNFVTPKRINSYHNRWGFVFLIDRFVFFKPNKILKQINRCIANRNRF